MAQIYKNGLVIQIPDSNISAFMEREKILAHNGSIIQPNLPTGIGRIVIMDGDGQRGDPVITHELPPASIEYHNMIFFVNNEYYKCIYNFLSNKYVWQNIIIDIAESVDLHSSNNLVLVTKDNKLLMAQAN